MKSLKSLMALAFERGVWRMFPFWERLGLNVIPVGYNSPLPDIHRLKGQLDRFEDEYPLTGIDLDVRRQLGLLRSVLSKYDSEYQEAGGNNFGVQESTMRSFAPINALSLYAFIRHFKPRRMIELGGGMSTEVAAAAFLKNRTERKRGEFISVEPYPSPRLRKGFEGLDTLLEKKAEDLPLEMFSKLGRNDILFIDTSHVVKVFGDVNHIFLRVLPRLRRGVIIHIHDIFLPYEYPPHHFLTHGVKQVWQEQYLLHAFLLYNRHFRVMLASSLLHRKHLSVLKECFPWYHDRRWPSSFWMQRVHS